MAVGEHRGDRRAERPGGRPVDRRPVVADPLRKVVENRDLLGQRHLEHRLNRRRHETCLRRWLDARGPLPGDQKATMM